MQRTELGSLLKNLRKRSRLSLHELAKRVGVSASTLNRFENGNDKVMLATVEKAFAVLGAKLHLVVLPTQLPLSPSCERCRHYLMCGFRKEYVTLNRRYPDLIAEEKRLRYLAEICMQYEQVS